MVTVHLGTDPDTPFIELVDADDDDAVPVDVEPATVARWRDADAAFREAQREMWAAYRTGCV